MQYFTFYALGACLGVGAAAALFTGFLLWSRVEPNAFNPVTYGEK